MQSIPKINADLFQLLSSIEVTNIFVKKIPSIIKFHFDQIQIKKTLTDPSIFIRSDPFRCKKNPYGPSDSINQAKNRNFKIQNQEKKINRDLVFGQKVFGHQSLLVF